MKGTIGVVVFVMIILLSRTAWAQEGGKQSTDGHSATCSVDCKGVTKSDSLSHSGMAVSLEEKNDAHLHSESNPAPPLQMGVSSTFVIRNDALNIDELHPSFYGPIKGVGEAYVWFDFRVLESGDNIEQKVHVEEAFVDLNQWSKNLTIRAGKYRLNFGRINPTHPHDWHFINQGLALRNFLGPEALFGRGVSVDYRLPGRSEADRFNVNMAYLTEEMEPSGEEELPYRAAFGKIKGLVFETLSSNLQIGLNLLKGRYGPNRQWDFTLWDFEVNGEKSISSRHVLEFQSEVLINRRGLTDGTMAKTYGYYAQADFLLEGRIQMGLRYDWSQLATSEAHESGLAILYGHPIGEKTRLRVQLERNALADGRRGNKAMAQLIFIVGTHKHPYPMPKWMH